MSWENIRTDEKTCPCGKGTYSETLSSDDWNRYRTTWAMNCPDCRVNYRLFEFIYYHHGMAETGYRWVELEIYDRAMEMIAHSDRLEHECVEDAMTKYLEIFVQRWATLSKKEIWNKLNEGLPYCPSLGTFYKHTKGLEKRKYIAEQFRYEQLPDMLCLIGVKDELIETNLYKAKQLKLDAEKLLHGR